MVLMMGQGETGSWSCLAMFNMKNISVGRYMSNAKAYCKADCMLLRSVLSQCGTGWRGRGFSGKMLIVADSS
eukprot:3929940-Rhodomonas_salina.1